MDIISVQNETLSENATKLKRIKMKNSAKSNIK